MHIYQWWDADAVSLKRMLGARETWKEFYKYDKWGVLATEFRLVKSSRSSLAIGEKLGVPFIKDVIEYGLASNPDCNLFLFTNSDAALVIDASGFVRSTLKSAECGYCHRVDFEQSNYPKQPVTREELKRSLTYGTWSGGSDIFFFTRAWWRNEAVGFPDVLVGFEGWDACMMALMLRSGLGEPINWISYHQAHLSYWKIHRLDAVGQVYNRKVCSEWAWRNNLGHLINNGNYLFKIPVSYNVVL